MVKCRTCGKDFDTETKRKIRGGYFNQCIKCSTGDRKVMYLGRPGRTSKGANIEIFRSDLEFVRKVLRRECAVGFTANLGISTQSAIQNFEGKKEEEKR